MPSMRRFVLALILTAALASPAAAQSPDLSAAQWLEASAAQFTATSSAVDLRLVRTRSGKERTVTLQTRMSRRDAGVIKTWILQLSPDVQAGTQFLTLVRGEQEEQYHLMPAVGTVSRVSPAENFSLFGTDFQIRDISIADPAVGEHRVLRGDEVLVAGVPYAVTVIESTYETGKHRRLLRYLDNERKLPLKVEYFDKKDQLTKRLSVLEVAMVDNTPIATLSRMENLQRGTRTDLIVDSARFDLGEDALPESTFTKEHMRSVGARYAAPEDS